MNFRSSPLIYRAFTLIELLIVIVIIGILATAFIPKITGMQDRARYARVEKDFRDFRTAVFMAQTNTNKPLIDIVGDDDVIYPDCYVGSNVMSDWHKLPSNHACRISRISALRKIENAAGMSSGTLAGLETDPRGSPYGLDPNEGQVNYSNCSARDTFYSGGPDGYIYSDHAGHTTILSIPPMGCPGAY